MRRKIALALCAGLFLITASGCALLVAGAAGGAGTAAWLSGKLSRDVNVSSDRVLGATRSALKSLSLAVDKETKLPEITQVRSNYTDGREIWIDIKPITKSSSQINVRVGLTGDKEAAEKIMQRIVRYL